jgi:hypothetical protein
MSYDFYVTGAADNWHEPTFSDTHPAFDSDGAAGVVMLTDQGYSRCGNYTSNVSWMWTRCLTAVIDEFPDLYVLRGEDDRRHLARDIDRPRTVYADRMCLRDLHGARMADIAPLLARAVEWGVEHIDELREGNPANGWGNAEGAITYLWDIQRTCEQCPDGTLGICS